MQGTTKTPLEAPPRGVFLPNATTAQAYTTLMPLSLHQQLVIQRLETLFALCNYYRIFSAVVAMARRANAPVPGMPELDAAKLERFRNIRDALLVGRQVPNISAELYTFFHATQGCISRALTPEVEHYARLRVATSHERQQWLQHECCKWEAGTDTLLWQQIKDELRDIRTELCEYRAFEAFWRAKAGKRTRGGK